MEAYVTSVLTDGLATIEFFHPKGNSMPSAQLTRLTEAITLAGQDPMVQVILLRSGGEKAFCAGANFDELLAISGPDEGRAFFLGFANVINAMRRAPQLIICRVQGKCVGGGVGIAAAADYTMATVQAEVKLSELAVGLGPFVVGPAVERKTGLSAFSQLTLHATAFHSASWAREKGLFTELYDNISDLDTAAAGLTSALLKSNPEAMRELKKVFWAGTEHWDTLLQERAETSGRLVLSGQSREFLGNRDQQASGKK
jgi:methylglutaconyl-CoA hydratase